MNRRRVKTQGQLPDAFKALAAHKFEERVKHAKAHSFNMAIAQGASLKAAIDHQAKTETHLRSTHALCSKGKTISIRNGVVCSVDGKQPVQAPPALPCVSKDQAEANLKSLKSAGDWSSKLPHDLAVALRDTRLRCSCSSH